MPLLAEKYPWKNFDFQTIFGSGDSGDFFKYDTALFTTTASAGGTVTVQALPGGVVKMDTGIASTNAEVYISTAQKWFQPGTTTVGQAFRIETRIEIAEVATNQANVGLFLTNNAATGLLAAASTGPVVPFTGAALFKTGGTSVWQAMASDGASQRLVATGSALPNEGQEVVGSYTTLAIEITPVGAPSATVASAWNVTFLVDGYSMINSVIATPTPISFQLANMPAANTYFGTVGLKNGGAFEETMLVDYLVAAQRRLVA